MIGKTLAGAVVGALAAGPSPAAAKRKLLLVSGGWEGHEPVKARDFWLPRLEADGFEVVTASSHDPYADPALMATVDVVVQNWTMGTIAKESRDGLLAAVRSGTGLAGWHGGLADAYRQETDYAFMVGGRF